MDHDLQEAFRFFHANAGGIVGEHAVCALHLAKAEEWAQLNDLRVDWEPDHIEDLSWMSDAERAQPHECYCAVLRDPEGTVLAVLGGIVDPDRKYTRVVEAELASEAWHDEHRRCAAQTAPYASLVL